MGSAGNDAESVPSDGETGHRSTVPSRIVSWLLVDGSRLGLALGAAAVTLVSLIALAELDVIAFTNPDSLTRMASGMIAGTFSLVTVVVSVNQLILSQEFSPAGTFRDRREGVESFYGDVEDAADVAAAPTGPAALLELLARTVHEGAQRLAETADDLPGEASRERTVRLAADVEEPTSRLEASLEGSNETTYDAVSAAVRYDDAKLLYDVRRRRGEVDGPPQLDDALENLVSALRLFDTAKEHLMTVYMQRELTRFSQLTVYLGIPAVMAAVLLALLYGDLGGATLSHTYLPYVVSLLATVIVIPLFLLASFILRVATVTRRTATIGPLLARREAERSPDVSVDRST